MCACVCTHAWQTLDWALNLPVKISKMVVSRKRKQALKYMLDRVNDGE